MSFPTPRLTTLVPLNEEPISTSSRSLAGMPLRYFPGTATFLITARRSNLERSTPPSLSWSIVAYVTCARALLSAP